LSITRDIHRRERRHAAWWRPSLLAVALAGAPAAAQESLDAVAEIQPFAREVAAEHGIDPARIESVLAGARVLPGVLAAMQRPAEAKPWRDYRPIFLTEQRIAAGAEFWAEHAALLARARAQFGVPERIIVAIIGVETFYGTRAGSIRVLDALATLGFRYPKRAAFFRRELGHFLVLGASEDIDVTAVVGSYAGAMGIPQFIPSSYRAYAVDFDGDGQRDLIGSVADATGSVAAYLSRHGWVRDADVAVPATVSGEAVRALIEKGLEPHTSMAEFASAGVAPALPVQGHVRAALIELDGEQGREYWFGFRNFYAVTRYNRSPLYAMAVHQLADAIEVRRRSAGR
jgi:membrane-bound lytic murein transglycosylase B